MKKNVTFSAIDIETEDHENLVEKFNIKSVPTTVIVNGKELLYKQSGIIKADELLNKIKELNKEYGN